MNPLMLLWTEKFKGYYKGVRTEVEGQGSSKAMPALIEGASSFGPMSRDAKSNEIADFEKKFGYKPMMIPTAIDLLAVYVHRDNPLSEISLPQLDSIFSSTRKLGGDPIDQWGDLGLTGKYETANVAMFGRNAASGTYGFFKEKVLGNGDYGDLVNEQPGSTAFQCNLNPEETSLYVMCQRVNQTDENKSEEGNVLHSLKIDQNGVPSINYSRHLGLDGIYFRSRPQGIVTINK